MNLKKKLLLTLVIVILAYPAFAGNVSFSKVYEWGTGLYECGAIKGNYAFCGGKGTGLEIVDISNPSKPVRIKKIDTAVGFSSSIINGNYLYMGGKYTGIYVFDISNALNPVLVRNISQMETEKNLIIYNNYLFASTSGTMGLNIFQISDPSNPVKVNTFNDAGKILSFVQSGHYLYCLLHDYTVGPLVKVLDISNPAAPSLVYTYSNTGFDRSSGNFSSLAVSGNYLYIWGITKWSGDNKLVILDISNPTLPVEAKTMPFAPVYQVILNGRYGYITSSNYQLKTIDLNDPLTPVVTHSLDMGFNLNEMKISGNKLFLWLNEGGMEILDISSPGNPSRLSHLNDTAMYSSVVVSNRYAYLSGYGLSIFDISSPASPVLTGYTHGSGAGSILSGNFLYALIGGFGVYDVSNPTAPKKIYETDEYTYHDSYDLSVSGNNLFLSDADRGLKIFDVSDPSNPSETNGIHIHGLGGEENYAESHLAVGKFFYLKLSSKLYIFDISQRPDAVLLGTLSTWGGRVYASPSLDHLFIVHNTEILIVNISTPVNPKQEGVINTGTENIRQIVNDGNYLYVATGTNGLQVYNISDPANPYAAGKWSGETYISDFAIQGNYLYAAAGNSGKFYILSISKTPDAAIKIISPNGGETLKTGSTFPITWSSEFVSSDVNIAIYKNNNLYSNLGTTQVSAGTFSWVISPDLPEGNDYKIRIYQGNTGDFSDSNFSIVSPPQISLNKTSLHFKAVKGIQTSPQSVGIMNGGGGVLNWAAQTSQSWITVTPNSGTGNKTIQVSINPSGLGVGNYTGTISISDQVAQNSPQVIQVALTVSESGTVPFGEFSTPVNASTVTGSIPVTGWALDDMEVTSVKIYRDPVTGESSGESIYIGDGVFIEGSRPDVETAYPDFPFNYRAGWGYMLLTNMLPNNGNGTFTLYAKATDREGNVVTLGTKTISCDNAHGVKPFGAIDTPFQGGEVSGSEYVNFGWVLTPMPNTVPVDGSTITVWVDGVAIGHPGYNVYREDIATLFPGYMNSNGAGGYYYLDTTKYTDGLHTISWTVEDNAGNQDGIGSRYFTISNGDGATGESTNPILSNIKSFSGVQGAVLQKSHLVAGGIEKDEIEINKLEINELGHIEISLPGCMEGYMVVGEERRALPVGSTLDTVNGVFYWNPGPGFVGSYRLEFVCSDSDGVYKKNMIEIHINLPQMNTDKHR